MEAEPEVPWVELLVSPTQTTPATFWAVLAKWTAAPAYKQIQSVTLEHKAVHTRAGVTGYTGAQAAPEHGDYAAGTERIVFTRTLHPADYQRKSPMCDRVEHDVAHSCITWSHAMPSLVDLPAYYVQAKAYRIELIEMSEHERAQVEIVKTLEQPAKKGEQRAETRPYERAEPKSKARKGKKTKNERRKEETLLAGEHEAVAYDDAPFQYKLRFAVQPFPAPAPSLDTVKLLRVCRSQLALMNRWAKAERAGGYEKRVLCDQVVPRDDFNTHYRRLRATYGYWVQQWPECTDASKFVFEDLAIAAFLLALWDEERRVLGLADRQHFVDVGTGNGFLVYVLTMEGHAGTGIDLRARKIWALYPPEVQLLEAPIAADTASYAADWLLANHSDELTPWVPLMAARGTAVSASASQVALPQRYFVLPCCEWDFDRKYQRTSAKSRYEAYLEYVAHLGAARGYAVETEHLRIPSTRNVAHIGRERGAAQLTEEELKAAAAYQRFVPQCHTYNEHRQ